MKKVAVINSNEDVVDAIRIALGQAGFATAGAHVVDFKRGRRSFAEFLSTEQPDAILLDIAPPYEENWKFYETLKGMELVRNVPFILTTTNVDILKKVAGADVDAIEIVGKPFDLNRILEHVRHATEQGTTSLK